MAERGVNLSSIKWFGLVITIIALTNITIILDIPVLRQILGFIFLTFIPGFVLLSLLKLNRLGLLEKIVLSVGLSLAFLMLFGLLVNSLSLALGYTKPLSTVSLLISFSTATIILAIIAYIRNKAITFSSSNLRLTTREKALLILPSLFPLLSIVGMRIMNLTDNNIILMVLLFLIPAYVIFISFYRSQVPQRLYPSLIYLISISLILMLSLRSNHIMGSDPHVEYYFFQTTLNNLYWSVLGPNILDACLSISLLPSIYQIFLNINPEYLFKVLFSLLFSISPLVVYIISKKYIGNFYAFLASLFFTSQMSFLWAIAANRSVIAILFFALAIMVLFHDGVSGFNKRLLFIIFVISCIVSQYAISYIFLFVMLLTWAGMQIIPRILLRKRKATTPSENPAAGSSPHDLLPDGGPLRSNVGASKSVATEVPQSQLKGGITITIVVLFFAILFFWYSQVTIAAFGVGAGVIHRTFANLSQWFLLESKGGTTAAALGEGIYTIPQQIRVVVSWLTVAFIAIGVLTTVARYKRMITIPKSGDIKPNFLQSKFSIEYFVLAAACSAILVLSVGLPIIAKVASMERIYFHMMTVLSPFFVIGGIMVAKWLRARPHWIILVVLIPFFMCTTGTMYQIFGVPASMALNSSGKEYEINYTHDQESYAGKWLKEYSEERANTYTISGAGRKLVSLAGIPDQKVRSYVLLEWEQGKKINGYIYLTYLNVAKGKATVPPYTIVDVAPYLDLLAGNNKIYATNGSEIYR